MSSACARRHSDNSVAVCTLGGSTYEQLTSVRAAQCSGTSPGAQGAPDVRHAGSLQQTVFATAQQLVAYSLGNSKCLLCRAGSPARRAERDVAADALAGYSRGVVLDKTEGQAKLAPAEKCAPAASER